MDPDMAKAMHEQAKLEKLAEEERAENGEEPEKEKGRSPRGYTPEIQALHVLDEHVQALIRITVMANGDGKSKPPDISRWPAPVTAIQLAELDDEAAKMRELSAEFRIGQREQGLPTDAELE